MKTQLPFALFAGKGHNQSGMALLITIMTLSLLTAVTIQFQKATWHKLLVSDNYKRDVQLRAIADSGINIAFAALENDFIDNEFDTLIDSWAELENENLGNLFPAGDLKLQLSDLSGRLQINSLVAENIDSEDKKSNGIAEQNRIILKSLLLSGIFDIEEESEAEDIIGAIIDWIDEDDNESDHGTESGYYQSLEKPYSCRNGAIQYVEELLFVRGITPELLFGTKEVRGLEEFITVYGDDGKININTADTVLIKAMNSLITDELIEDFDSYRRDESNLDQLADSGWYSAAGWPGDIELDQDVLTTVSHYFQLEAVAEFDTLSWELVVKAERTEDGEIHMLRRKVEQ